jgi:uncharacterized protein (DUF1501 family)
MVDRRGFLRISAELTLLAPFANVGAAVAEHDSRFVLVILRGGLDGLAAVPPYGDGSYSGLRGPLALGAPGAGDGVLKLDGLFGLHPALTNMHAMHRDNELIVLHAVATPYRERSHFDGQKVLENGGVGPSLRDGWLNRTLTELAQRGAARQAVALAESVPLVLRGSFAVSSWTPSRLPDMDEDTMTRVQALYEAVDPDLAATLLEARHARDIAGGAGEARRIGGRGGAQVTRLVTAAARFLSRDDGPRIAVIDVGGWDTHANQGAAQGSLANRLRILDVGLSSLKSELGPHWASTSVLIVTEFGRTAGANGTPGTDHGTASCAFLAGGAVAGGRVVADWPGLSAHELYEGRDLKPTLDLRSVAMGLVAEQFGLSDTALARVFPDSRAVEPLVLTS